MSWMRRTWETLGSNVRHAQTSRPLNPTAVRRGRPARTALRRQLCQERPRRADYRSRVRGHQQDQRGHADDDHVKRIKIQSQLLSRWWGHSIYLGATVLLPRDYDKHPDVKYPVIYDEGHFSLGAPGGYGRAAARGPNDFTMYWDADRTP